MKIGMVVDNELYGDVRVLNEARYLAGKGYCVEVLCLTYGQLPREETIDGIRVTRIPIRKEIKNKLFALNALLPAYDRWWRKHIAAFVTREAIQVLHVHDLYLAHPAHQALRRKGIPLVLDLHENYPAAVMTYKWANQFPFSWLARPSIWQKRERRYLGYARKIIVLSESYRDQLLQKYPGLKESAFVVYPNVPSLDEFSSYPVDHTIFDKGSSFLLFYFGVIAERRGIFTSIEALRELLQRGHDVKLLLIGRVDKDDQARFQACLQDPSLQPALVHYPWKDISLLPSYVHVSDVCLSPIFRNPQHESGVANKIFQYMLFERPLLVSDCFPQKRIVEEEGCGLAFESENAVDMADKVVQLLENPQLRQKMGANGKLAVHSKYNLEIAGQRLLQMYQELLPR
jgi:glycosyltransferase involved in cell wall biosynthesis